MLVAVAAQQCMYGLERQYVLYVGELGRRGAGVSIARWCCLPCDNTNIAQSAGSASWRTRN
jgi:hypothetical protein